MNAFYVSGAPVTWRQVAQHAMRHGDLGFARSARRAFIVADECNRRQIVATAAELQEAADRFRRRRGLFSAQQTSQWLSSSGLTVDDIEALAEEEVLSTRLRDEIAASGVDELFDAAPTQLAFYEFSRISVDDEGIARELYALISNEEESFADMVLKYSIDREASTHDGKLPPVCGIDLPDYLSAAALSSQVSDLLGPFLGSVWEIYRVDAIHPPQRDERTASVVKRHLFEKWLNRQEALAPLQFAAVGPNDSLRGEQKL